MIKKMAFVLAACLLLGFAGAGEAAENVQPGSPEALSQELQRTKDLLEIWKGHVKTLTTERDQALQAVDQLKAQGLPSSAATPASTKVVGDLKARINELESENEDLKSRPDKPEFVPPPPAPNVSVLESEISGLKSKLAAARRGDGQVQSLQQELEKARQQVQDLQALVKQTQEENQSRPSDAEINALQSQIQPLQQELDKAHRAKEEADENYASLRKKAKAEIDKLKAHIDNLQTEKSDSHGLEEQLQAARAETEVARQAYADLETNFRTEQESLKGQIAELRLENHRAGELKQELESLQLYKESAQAAYTNLQNSNLAEQQRLRARLAALQSASDQQRGLQEELVKAQKDKEQLEQYILELKDLQTGDKKKVAELQNALDGYSKRLQTFRSGVESSLEALTPKSGKKQR